MAEQENRVLQFALDATHGELAALVGPLDENLRQIEHAFAVRISRRGAHFRLEGAEARKAMHVLEMLAARVQSGGELTISDVQMAVIGEQTGAAASDESVFALKTRRSGLQPRTPGQRRYLSAIMSTDVTFGVGPAGTGKTYLAAPGHRGGRAAGVSSRRPGAEGRSLSAAALRRAL